VRASFSTDIMTRSVVAAYGEALARASSKQAAPRLSAAE
jgi:hypothetical protein